MRGKQRREEEEKRVEEERRKREEEMARARERAQAEYEAGKREEMLQAERRARAAAEAEAREAQRAAQQRTREAMEAEAPRGRAAGWNVFLVMAMGVAGIAAYAWWQGQANDLRKPVGGAQVAAQAAGKMAGETTVGPVAAAAVTARPEGSPHREGAREGERRTVRVGSREVALRWCPAGTFMMGSPEGEEGRDNDETQHLVTLTRGFWMGETEVTQGLWREVMKENPSHFKNGDNYPVEQVSWEDCQKFVQTLNTRYPQEGMRWALPTEAQWEYACRAGTTGPYAGTGLLEDMGWYGSNSGRQTHPVGRKKPNAWGLYDMHGNVWEWCADWYGGYPGGLVTDPPGAQSGSGRVDRGGSWRFSARFCRSAIRVRNWPVSRSDDLGLRVALLPVQ